MMILNTNFLEITARKARAWRRKLNLYIGILFPAKGFMETSETNRLLNEYFAQPSTLELSGFSGVDGPDVEFGKVSDKSDYLLFRMREAVKTFTYSTQNINGKSLLTELTFGENHCIARICSCLSGTCFPRTK